MAIDTKTPHGFRSSTRWIPKAGLCGTIFQTASGELVITTPDGINWTRRTNRDYMFADVMQVLREPISQAPWLYDDDGASEPWENIAFIEELDMFILCMMQDTQPFSQIDDTRPCIKTSGNGCEWTTRITPEITP